MLTQATRYILWADQEMVKDQTPLAGNHHSDEQSADNNPRWHSSMSERSSGYHTSGKQSIIKVVLWRKSYLSYLSHLKT